VLHAWCQVVAAPGLLLVAPQDVRYAGVQQHWLGTRRISVQLASHMDLLHDGQPALLEGLHSHLHHVLANCPRAALGFLHLAQAIRLICRLSQRDSHYTAPQLLPEGGTHESWEHRGFDCAPSPNVGMCLEVVFLHQAECRQ